MIRSRHIPAFLKASALAFAVAFAAQSAVQAAPAQQLYAHNYHQGTLQTLQYGQIEGLREEGILSFYNVPYAKAPVGQLRFKAPQNPDTWTAVLKTQTPGPDGIQPAKNGTRGEESCLNLNVFRPDNDHTGLPVLVYIHGGNNQTGSAQDFVPYNLVKKGDVIVVSLNYRLGLLGFNPLPALKTGTLAENSGNYTLLDIKQALDFIRANAWAFGGNPENITVSGFSAGGRDVMAMLISPLFKDSFHKAISFSGGMTTADPAVSAQIVAERLSPLAVRAGLAADDAAATQELLSSDKAVYDFLYRADAASLAAAFGDAGIRMAAFPHLYSDGTVLPQDGFDTDTYNSVPLIMLTGTKEFSGFAQGDPYYAAGIQSKEYETDDAFRASFEFAVKYGSQLYELFNAQESAVRMLEHYDAPVYTCSINFGNDPAVVGEDMAFLTGATHGIFLPLLTDAAMGARAAYPEAFASAGAQQLTADFMQYIINFLWTDTPNGQNLPRWQPWQSTTAGPADMIFDADKEQAHIYQSTERLSYEAILQAIRDDSSVSAEEKARILSRVLNGRWWSNGLDQAFGNENVFLK